MKIIISTPPPLLKIRKRNKHTALYFILHCGVCPGVGTQQRVPAGVLTTLRPWLQRTCVTHRITELCSLMAWLCHFHHLLNSSKPQFGNLQNGNNGVYDIDGRVG